ncbi:MAG TPA: GNAT family N-acetyltransferase [Acidimicrobiales bacterium]|nr:GNAT family N-acetyltransferase [Acidimicrobiales bacterium]
MESARPAARSDVEHLVQLWRQALTELDGHRGGALLAGGLARPDLRSWLSGALADPERALVVGLIEGTPVGLASAFAERSGGGGLGVVDLIYVDPAARQVGVGEAMLSQVLSWCERLGLAGLDAPALPGSRSAKSFFEDNGFQARLLVMHRPVRPRGDGL